MIFSDSYRGKRCQWYGKVVVIVNHVRERELRTLPGKRTDGEKTNKTVYSILSQIWGIEPHRDATTPSVRPCLDTF